MINKHLLPRINQRISFLYVEHAKIVKQEQELNLITQDGTFIVPGAMLLCFILGPGTSITHDALTLITQMGSTCIWAGQDSLKTYAIGESLNHSSDLILKQADAVTHRKKHLAIARKMYQMRFPNEDFTGLSIAKMRGKEGTRMKKIYQENANKYHISWHGRHYDETNYYANDAINQALTTANQFLYGICTAIIIALGFSPSLGFIHVGLSKSFIYDVADLYKAKLSIPIAFKTISETGGTNFYQTLRTNMQLEIKKQNFIPQIVHDLLDLFDVQEPTKIEML